MSSFLAIKSPARPKVWMQGNTLKGEYFSCLVADFASDREMDVGKQAIAIK